MLLDCPFQFGGFGLGDAGFGRHVNRPGEGVVKQPCYRQPHEERDVGAVKCLGRGAFIEGAHVQNSDLPSLMPIRPTASVAICAFDMNHSGPRCQTLPCRSLSGT